MNKHPKPVFAGPMPPRRLEPIAENDMLEYAPMPRFAGWLDGVSRQRAALRRRTAAERARVRSARPRS